MLPNSVSPFVLIYLTTAGRVTPAPMADQKKQEDAEVHSIWDQPFYFPAGQTLELFDNRASHDAGSLYLYDREKDDKSVKSTNGDIHMTMMKGSEVLATSYALQRMCQPDRPRRWGPGVDGSFAQTVKVSRVQVTKNQSPARDALNACGIDTNCLYSTKLLPRPLHTRPQLGCELRGYSSSTSTANVRILCTGANLEPMLFLAALEDPYIQALTQQEDMIQAWTNIVAPLRMRWVEELHNNNGLDSDGDDGTAGTYMSKQDQLSYSLIILTAAMYVVYESSLFRGKGPDGKSVPSDFLAYLRQTMPRLDTLPMLMEPEPGSYHNTPKESPL